MKRVAEDLGMHLGSLIALASVAAAISIAAWGASPDGAIGDAPPADAPIEGHLDAPPSRVVGALASPPASVRGACRLAEASVPSAPESAGTDPAPTEASAVNSETTPAVDAEPPLPRLDDVWPVRFGRWRMSSNERWPSVDEIRSLFTPAATDRVYDLSPWIAACARGRASWRDFLPVPFPTPCERGLESAREWLAQLSPELRKGVGLNESPEAWLARCVNRERFRGDVAIGPVDDAGRVRFRGSTEDAEAFEALLDAEFWVGGPTAAIECVRLEFADARAAGFASPVLESDDAPPRLVARTTADAAISRAGTRATRVSLDVGVDRSVFAHTGEACVYVGDYDVEISQATCGLQPCFGLHEVGLAVEARLRTDADSGLRVDVTARSRPRLVGAGFANLPVFTTSLSWGSRPDVSIEVPYKDDHRADAVASAPFPWDDAAVISMSDGGALVLRALGPPIDVPRRRAWRLWDPARDSDFDVEVAQDAFIVSGETVAVRVEPVPRSRTEGPFGIEIIMGDPVSWLRWPTTRPAADREADARDVARPLSVELVAGPVEDARRIDVAVTWTRPLDPPTRVVEGQAWNPEEQNVQEHVYRLPQMRRAVVPLRCLLRSGETQEREVVVDLGSGPERWTVSVTRRAD